MRGRRGPGQTVPFPRPSRQRAKAIRSSPLRGLPALLSCSPATAPASGCAPDGHKSILRHQGGVSALLRGAPVGHHHHQIGVPHRGQAVRHHNGGAAPPQMGERLLHRRLAFRVQRAGRLVQQQNTRVAQQRARQRHPLALAAGQALTTRTDAGRIAVRQRGDEVGRRGLARGGLHLGLALVQSSHADVCRHEFVEQQESWPT